MKKLADIYSQTINEEKQNSLLAAQRLAKSEGPEEEKSLEYFIEQSKKMQQELEAKILDQLPSTKTYVSVTRQHYPELFKIMDKVSARSESKSIGRTDVSASLLSVSMYSAAWKSVVDYYHDNGLNLLVVRRQLDDDHEFRISPMVETSSFSR